jgi:hypothetical protein
MSSELIFLSVLSGHRVFVTDSVSNNEFYCNEKSDVYLFSEKKQNDFQDFLGKSIYFLLLVLLSTLMHGCVMIGSQVPFSEGHVTT